MGEDTLFDTGATCGICNQKISAEGRCACDAAYDKAIKSFWDDDVTKTEDDSAGEGEWTLFDNDEPKAEYEEELDKE
jgi:hypothetical protein